MMKPTRRQILGWTAGLGAAYGLGLATPRVIAYVEEARLRRAIDAVLPLKSLETGLDLGPPVAKLVAAGAIDPGKFRAAHERRGPLPRWVEDVLAGKQRSLVLSADNASYNLSLLWPLGLATRTAFNARSPIAGDDLPNFASTGGWTLGKDEDGAAYFDAVDTLALDAAQEEAVHRLADGIFRPCCGNSAFFQDCNHGSAMLGLMELASSAGKGESEMLRLAKIANGFWYPRQYVEMALYFDAVEGLNWEEAPAAEVLSARYSSIRGYNANVRAILVEKGLVPPRGGSSSGGSGCAV
jgi:hypothetical protein